MNAYTSVKMVKTAKGRVDAAQRRPTPSTTRLDRTSGAICPKSSYLYAQSLDESVELSQRAFGAAAAVLLCGDDLVGSLDTGECHGGPNFQQSISLSRLLDWKSAVFSDPCPCSQTLQYQQYNCYIDMSVQQCIYVVK
jgi:hypothetical protein